MKHIQIKYNPYLIETDITVDGKKPKANSSLNVGKVLLQEWVELLPEIIVKEYMDKNVTIDFTGTTSDFEDLQDAFEAQKTKVSYTFHHHRTADIGEVEETIDHIFNDIQAGSLPELKGRRIVDAFQKAKQMRFEINVVATMSSGKSTLINALLGRNLMPSANMATTATIVKICNKNQKDFSAVAYDDHGKEVEKLSKVTHADMKRLNENPTVLTVELNGKIPFVSTAGMELVLVDTPGPNNARNARHKEMTYKMIADSDKSMVLYVLNGGQIGIEDDKNFLDYVCQKMGEGGKKSRERFIFAVNKMDDYNPGSDDGPGCIKRALDEVRGDLEGRGIYNPNLFPVCALPALEKRTDDEDDDELELKRFKSRSKKYPELRLQDYYQYNHLPLSVRNDIDDILKDENDDSRAEVYTGIVSIEQAICLYVNKYARPMKVRDLVSSFNDTLQELAVTAHLEEAISTNKQQKAELVKQIEAIQRNVESAESAKKRSEAIDKLDLTAETKTRIEEYLQTTRSTMNKMLAGKSNKVEKEEAKRQGHQLLKDINDLRPQVKVEIEHILQSAYKETVNKIIEEYKRDLAELNLTVDAKALTINPANLVLGSLNDISAIIEENTTTEDESYTVKATRKVRKKGDFFRTLFSLITFGLVNDYTMENEEYDKEIAKYVDYVNMNEVAQDFIMPVQKDLNKLEKDAIAYVQSETQRLKEYVKQELKAVDKKLEERLDALKRTQASSEDKASEVRRSEDNLKWLNDITKRVNDIIAF